MKLHEVREYVDDVPRRKVARNAVDLHFVNVQLRKLLDVESEIPDDVEQLDVTDVEHVPPFSARKFRIDEQFIITNSFPPLTIPPYIPLSTSFITLPSTIHRSVRLPFSSPTTVIFSNKQSLNISRDVFPFIIKFAPTFIISLNCNPSLQSTFLLKT